MHKAPFYSRNHLLAEFSVDSLLALSPFFETVSMECGESLEPYGEKPRFVYFPTDGIVSLLCLMENGTSTEVSLVGNEGLVGVAGILGGVRPIYHAVVTGSGHCYRLPARRLSEVFNRDAELRLLLMRYIQSLITQMAQAVVCIRHHSIEQRLCRWLLHSLDRQGSNQLVSTQALIANMLGVRREGVTDAAGKLQRLEIIHYRRGHITILDRQKLEQLCCECYGVVKRESDRLLYPAPCHTKLTCVR